MAEFGLVANLQSILTFSSVLLNDSNFVNEIVPGFGPICFTIIRTNGCSGFYELISDYIANFPAWQGCRESDNSQRELLSSSFQLDFVHRKIRNPQFEFRNSSLSYTG